MKTAMTAMMGVLLLAGLAAAPAMADTTDQASSDSAQGAFSSASGEGERLSGSALRDDVLGHRVTGAMADGSRYSEVYRVDGTIEGENYTGQSTIEGNQMCLDYGSGETTCYQVRRVDDQRIEWLQDGEVVGHGTISDAD